ARVQKTHQSGNKQARAEMSVIEKLLPVLAEGLPARTVALDDAGRTIAHTFFLLTMKPTIYAANVDEATLAAPEANGHVRTVRELARAEAAEVVVICAQLAAELVALPPAERGDYLPPPGATSTGVDESIKSAYRLLGLMSFLTAGEKEV